MKIKNLLLVCSLFLAGGVVATAGEQANSVDAADGDTYKLITTVEDLNAGDEVIIAAAKADYAMSTNQKSNNRGAIGITKSGDTISYVTSLQTFTVESGSAAGSYAFKTTNDSKYIYASGTSGNQLKSQTSKNDKASWNITISTDGVANVKAVNTSVRGVMQYNPNNGSPLFACYSSASQQPIAIYEKFDASSADTYNVKFSANGGTFADSNWNREVENGTEASGTLPTAEDLSSTPYDLPLVGWTDGDEVYEPGSSYSVSGATVYTAVYDNNISIERALEICAQVGTNKTSIELSTIGMIKSIDTAYSSSNNNISVYITDGTNQLLCYRLTGGSDLDVGDTIKVTGYLKTYSGKQEFDAGCTYEEVILETYEVMFDANNGSFVDGKGETIVKNTGELAEGTLPTVDDINLPFASITPVELVGWTDGTNTYAPGAAYSVESATVFSAVYQATEEITIEQALAICGEVGNNGTSFVFTTKGEVKSVDTAYDSSYQNITVTITDGENSIKCYRLKAGEGADASALAVGDYIEVTGVLKDFNGTNEFDAGCTFVNAEKPAPVVPEAAEQFTSSSKLETALSMSYTANGEEYSDFGNLALMLRLTFDYSAYDEDVTETGLVVTKQSKEAAEAFVAGSTTVSSFIDADKDGEYVIRIEAGEDVASVLDTQLYVCGYVVVDGETYVSTVYQVSFRYMLETAYADNAVAQAALAYWTNAQ